MIYIKFSQVSLFSQANLATSQDSLHPQSRVLASVEVQLVYELIDNFWQNIPTYLISQATTLGEIKQITVGTKCTQLKITRHLENESE